MRHIHTITYRAFNMTHTIRKIFKEQYTVFGIKSYLEKRHGDTATLISFTVNGQEFINHDYKPFRVDVSKSQKLIKL